MRDVMNKSSAYIFGLILLFATIVRFWQLGDIPAGFHPDEADYGYNAYSLLRTGKDEYGKPFPLIYRSFGDYKGAIYAYLTIPFIAVSGLHEWAVRAPSAVFGVLFIILVFAFVYKISNSYRLALLSMALAAISPLGVLLSRVQSDPLVGAFLFFFGLYTFLLWTKQGNIWHLIISLLSFYLGFFTYVNNQLFIIPFFLLLSWRLWKGWRRNVRVVTIILLGVFLLTIGGLLTSNAGTRLGQVSIFSTKDVQLPLEEDIREDGAMHAPYILTRMIHNKVTAYGQYFVDTIARYFSYDFLFRQASQPLREQVPNSGVLLLVDLPFLLIGLYTVFRKKNAWGITFAIWLVMVPAILTIAQDESPNIHRFIWNVIPIYYLTATGILALYDGVLKRHRVLVAVAIIGLYVIFEARYIERLFVHQPIHNPIYRNEPDKELALMLKRYAQSYNVIVTQKILEQMLFFWPIDPMVYQKEGSPRDTDNAWYRNFLFVSDACPSTSINPVIRSLKKDRILYVNKAECALGEDDKIITTIKYRNALDAYYIVEKNR